MLREELIKERTKALQNEIDLWAKENGVISGRETIHVSLIIKQNRKKINYNKTHLNIGGKRAKLVDGLITMEEWEKILSLPWKPKEKYYKEVVEFFMKNGNRAVSLKEKAVGGYVLDRTIFKNVDRLLRDMDSGFRLKECSGWKKGISYEEQPHKILRVVLSI